MLGYYPTSTIVLDEKYYRVSQQVLSCLVKSTIVQCDFAVQSLSLKMYKNRGGDCLSLGFLLPLHNSKIE